MGSGSQPGSPGEWLSAGLLHYMDEVAGDVLLARCVRLEVTQDAVLASPLEGILQQLRKGLQAVRVVGKPELARMQEQRASSEALSGD